MADKLQHMVAKEPNFFRNFDLRLGGYFQRKSEVAVAFFHRVFEELSKESKLRLVEEATWEDDENEGESMLAEGCTPESVDDKAKEPEALISTEAVYNATLRGGAVAFTIVSAAKKGNIWMAEAFWSFHDAIYLARLFEKMQSRVHLRSGRIRMRCQPRAFMNALIDFDAKNDKTVLRDRVCEAILHKRSVLSLLERHAFHVFTQSDPKRPSRLTPLLEFAVLYEVERYEDTIMKKEEYEKMVDKATWLGNIIADGVVLAVHDPERQSRPDARKDRSSDYGSAGQIRIFLMNWRGSRTGTQRSLSPRKRSVPTSSITHRSRNIAASVSWPL